MLILGLISLKSFQPKYSEIRTWAGEMGAGILNSSDKVREGTPANEGSPLMC